MVKPRPPGQRLSDTNPDLKPQASLRAPGGTKLGSGPELGSSSTLPAPQEASGRTGAKGPLLRNVTLLAEGPAQADALSQDPDKKGVWVGDIEIMGKLGEGGMGEVYWGQTKKADKDGKETFYKRYAIKVVSFDKALKGQEGEEKERIRQELYERFIDEVGVLSRIGHDNIVSIWAFGEDFGEEKYPYYVMEYLDGQDLGKKVEEKGALAWERLGPLMLQATKALGAAHNFKMKIEDRDGGDAVFLDHPIIHRDIKPENIFVITDAAGEEKVKVLDFGIASIKDSAREEKGILGTPFYMSPEQARCEEIDNRTDIYSLGATMYYILTGYTVFQAETFTALWIKLAGEPPMPLRQRRPDLDIPEDVEAIVQKCLEKDPAKRYQSMAELREDILRTGVTSDGRVQSGDGLGTYSAQFRRIDTPGGNITPSEGEAFSAPSQKKRRRKLFRGLMAGAATIAIAGAGAMFVMNRSQERESGQPQAQTARTVDAGSPMAEAMLRDAGGPTVTPLPMKEEKRTIRFRTGLEGVEVFSGERLLCVSGKDGTCGITLQKDEAIKATFKKPGYKEKTVEIFKDTSGSVPVALERKPRRVKPPMRVKPIWK
ncbi:MAG: serine/threonine-protein kinase [Candidatus Micrarchaeota archaeon]